MLEWKAAYSTGVADIDDQHKKLFQMINELGAFIDSKAEESRRIAHLRKTLKFLEHYAKIHFNFEEICMAKHRCPVGAQNKQAHAYFMEIYRTYQQRFEQEGYSDEMLHEVHKMCEDWLVNHICKIDTNLKSCVHRK